MKNTPSKLAGSGQCTFVFDYMTAYGDGSDSLPSVTTLGFSPTVSYFLLENFAVGGKLSFEGKYIGDTTADGNETSQESWAIVPTAGYNININKNLGWFPTIGFVMEFGSLSASELNANLNNNFFYQFGLELNSPVLVHFDGFFVGLGPSFAFDFAKKLSGSTSEGSETTVNLIKEGHFGLASVIGGVF